jgi:predicted  nucleic acid-binding Zn-ribbon protein
VSDRPDSVAALGDALSAGMREELREAQRERWRAEVRLQAALEQMRHFETKTRDAEEEIGDLRTLIAEQVRENEAITSSKAWQTVVRFRRFKSRLSLRRG